MNYGSFQLAKVKRQRVPRTHAGGVWTEAQYWSFIRGALRGAVRRYPVKQKVKQANRKAVIGKRHKFEYLCAHCSNYFVEKQVEVDHIIGAGSLRKYDDLPGFVERLFCEPANLQVLCLDCHRIKTNEEANERKESKAGS